MIHKLSFWGHPTVPDTKVSFTPGFNLLHAPNGRGKSTILELIAYSLFGTEALRASAGQEYPSLSTDLTLTVNNKAYQIVRSKKRTELLEQGIVVAVGTTAVNAFILRLFGYNGKVYNVANYVRQDHVKALTHVLRADDRRKVLENTIGLGIIDNVIKELGDSLRGLTAEAKALESVLATPLEVPVAPQGYVASREERLNELAKAYNQHNYLKGQLNSLRLVEPVAPAVADVSDEALTALNAEADDLIEKQQHFNNYEQQVKHLNAMAAAKPKLGVYAELIEQYSLSQLQELVDAAYKHKRILVKYGKLVDQLLALPLPKLTQEEIAEGNKQWELFTLWEDYQGLLASEHVDCPKCGEHFCVNHKDIADYPFTPDNPKPECKWSERELWQQSQIWADVVPQREKLAQERDSLWELADIATSFFAHKFPPEITKPQELDYDLLLQLHESYHTWLTGDYIYKLQKLEQHPPTDYSGVFKKVKEKISQAHTARNLWERFKFGQKTYIENLANATRITTELATLEADAIAYADYVAFDKVCNNYEVACRIFEQRQAERTLWQEKLTGLAADIDDYTLAVKGLKAAKNDIKNHLLPSLNTAASHLASLMSEGVISSVLMLDDFSIKAMKADRYRPVETFSGSEASIINLALRIALGQVLTHSVFSVLIGDEIDASMDSARTAAVWGSLSRLVEANKIKQVILVSHESEPIQVAGLNYVNFA